MKEKTERRHHKFRDDETMKVGLVGPRVPLRQQNV